MPEATPSPPPEEVEMPPPPEEVEMPPPPEEVEMPPSRKDAGPPPPREDAETPPLREEAEAPSLKVEAERMPMRAEEEKTPVSAEAAGADLKPRLRSLLLELRTEYKILDRVVYKGKNQHRRCTYFKFLLKVRRDVRLLLSSGLEEVFRSLFCVLDEKKPLQRFHMLESLKKTANSIGCRNYHERLLGIARLLSQMSEPLISAAIQTSSLLARSFFMSYSLTVLSILARIRVLVQQMLLDVVRVFNIVSTISREKHVIKLAEGGVEAFREYHPPCREVIFLSCVWEGDKYVLHERMIENKMNIQDEYVSEALPLSTPVIQYETIEVSDEEQTSKGFDKRHLKDADSDPKKKELLTNEGSAGIKISAENGDFCNSGNQLKDVESNTSKKVAFIQVRKRRAIESDETMTNKKLKLDQLLKDKTSETNDREDPFFRLLTTGL